MLHVQEVVQLPRGHTFPLGLLMLECEGLLGTAAAAGRETAAVPQMSAPVVLLCVEDEGQVAEVNRFMHLFCR